MHDGAGESRAVHTSQSQRPQRLHAARLQQLPHNPIRLLQASFQQYHTSSLVAKCDGCCASDDACAHNHQIGLMVDAPPYFAAV